MDLVAASPWRAAAVWTHERPDSVASCYRVACRSAGPALCVACPPPSRGVRPRRYQARRFARQRSNRCLSGARHPLVAQTAPLAVEGVAPQGHHPTGRWLPIAADGVEVFNPAAVTVTRYRYRGNRIPNPFLRSEQPEGIRSWKAGALRDSRRVRRAARGNGAAATPPPRPGPTQPAHRPSLLTGPGRVERSGDQAWAFDGQNGGKAAAHADRAEIAGAQ